MFNQLFSSGLALAANKAVKMIVDAAVKLRAITENYTIDLGDLSPAGLALAYTQANIISVYVSVLTDLGFESMIKSLMRSEVDTINYVTKITNNLNGLIASAGYDKVFRSALETEAARYDLLEAAVDPYEMVQQGIQQVEAA